MKKKSKKKNTGKFLFAAVCGILALLLILLVRCVDVAAIGPEGTSVGLSRLNQAAHDLTCVNMAWYNITDVLGFAAIFLVLVFAAAGFAQLVRRRSLAKVDREILALGGLYVVVFALYLFFEKFIVNYRPVIMPGDAHVEASFPSSHTMLASVILGSAMMVLPRYFKGNALRVLRAVCVVMIVVTVVGRLISGVHWFTDILGALLISGALLGLFSGLKERL